jgi:hypothetical protein
MAGAPIDRIPLYVTMLPVLGIVAWLAVGKVGLGFLALVLADRHAGLWRRSQSNGSRRILSGSRRGGTFGAPVSLAR